MCLRLIRQMSRRERKEFLQRQPTRIRIRLPKPAELRVIRAVTVVVDCMRKGHKPRRLTTKAHDAPLGTRNRRISNPNIKSNKDEGPMSTDSWQSQAR